MNLLEQNTEFYFRFRITFLGRRFKVSFNVSYSSVLFQSVSVFFSSDPKKIAYIQETVGETSSQSVVVAVDR